MKAVCGAWSDARPCGAPAVERLCYLNGHMDHPEALLLCREHLGDYMAGQLLR
jgi:hypothetical protein